MLIFNQTAKIAKIQVFDGRAEAQKYFDILSSLGLKVDNFFVGLNEQYERVYFIDEVLDFSELESLLKAYQIKMIA